MTERNKMARIRVLKAELEEKQKLLNKKLKLDEESGMRHLQSLLENDLDQAKLVIASQDVIEKLQKIAERLAELNAEEIMPLSDSMKAAFGADMAHSFEHVASEAIQTALESVRAAKDAIDNAVLKVEGKMAPSEPNSDMASYSEEPSDEVPAPEEGSQTQEAPEDSILATDKEDENPLGREAKESIDYKATGKKILESNTLTSLVHWILQNNKIPGLKNKVMEMAKKDPVGTAGWIYTKKKLHEGKTTEAKAESAARAMAKVIETNLNKFGSGKVKEVIHTFTSCGLTEDQSNKVLEAFKTLYGSSPEVFSAKKKKAMEDIQTTGDKADQPDPVPGSNPQQDNEDSAIAKIAKNVANNPASLNEPISSATNSSDLTAQEKSAINNKIQSVASQTGDSSLSVKDFLKDDVTENINEPHWPVNSKGQYKGEPMQTDYNKLKTKSDLPSKRKTPVEKADPSNEPKSAEEMTDEVKDELKNNSKV